MRTSTIDFLSLLSNRLGSIRTSHFAVQPRSFDTRTISGVFRQNKHDKQKTLAYTMFLESANYYHRRRDRTAITVLEQRKHNNLRFLLERQSYCSVMILTVSSRGAGSRRRDRRRRKYRSKSQVMISCSRHS